MATRVVDILLGIIPIALLLPIFTNLFGSLLGGQLQAYLFDVVTSGAGKTNVTAVNRQYTGIPSMANYVKMYYLRLSNSTTTDRQIKVRIAETDDTATPLSSSADVAKIIVPAQGKANYQLIFYLFAPSAPDAATLNGKYLRFEFDPATDVDIAGVLFVQIPTNYNFTHNRAP